MNDEINDRTAYQIMEDVAAQVCQRICKYYELYGDDEEKEEELHAVCEKCPLQRLI